MQLVYFIYSASLSLMHAPDKDYSMQAAFALTTRIVLFI